MTQPPTQTPPGWYPDPSGAGNRWWDGNQWGQLAPQQPMQYATSQPGMPPYGSPPAPSSGGGKGCLIAAAVVVVIAIAGFSFLAFGLNQAAKTLTKGIEKSFTAGMKDVAPNGACTIDGSVVTLKVFVTNNSSEQSTYSITGTAVGDGNVKVADLQGGAINVEPGAKVESSIIGAVSGEVPGAVSCSVTQVFRTSVLKEITNVEVPNS
jgi:Protein of unknown function (DUF2510)